MYGGRPPRPVSAGGAVLLVPAALQLALEPEELELELALTPPHATPELELELLALVPPTLLEKLKNASTLLVFGAFGAAAAWTRLFTLGNFFTSGSSFAAPPCIAIKSSMRVDTKHFALLTVYRSTLRRRCAFAPARCLLCT